MMIYPPPQYPDLPSHVGINYGAIELAAPKLGGSTLANNVRGLLSLVLFKEGFGVPFDYAIQRQCTVGGTPTWVSGRQGWAGNSPSAADYYILPSNGVFETAPSNLNGSNEVTIAVIRRKRDTTLRSSALFGVLGTGTSSRCGAHVPFSDGTIYWDFGGASGSNRLTWTGYSVSTEIEKWVFVAGSRGMAIYFNGKLVSSSATAVTRGAGGNFAIGSGNGSTGGNADLQEYYYFGMFNQQWDQQMVLAWTANPYRFLNPPFYQRMID